MTLRLESIVCPRCMPQHALEVQAHCPLQFSHESPSSVLKLAQGSRRHRSRVFVRFLFALIILLILRFFPSILWCACLWSILTVRLVALSINCVVRVSLDGCTIWMDARR